MTCRTFPLNTLKNYKFVVTISFYQGKLMLSRHKERTTWEFQGGHIEQGESPSLAAERELFEESGARKYRITPCFDYQAGKKGEMDNGMVFLAFIEEIGTLPDSEIGEIRLFEKLPEDVTYPDISPVLFREMKFRTDL